MACPTCQGLPHCAYNGGIWYWGREVRLKNAINVLTREIL